MRYILFILLSGILSSFAFASEIPIRGVVYDKGKNNEPIVGANIYWAGTTQGTVTNEDGEFEVARLAGKLVVSFVGYHRDTLIVEPNVTSLTVQLLRDIELDEVVVRERRKGVYHSTLNPIQVQKLTTTELQKAACCNLSESFETNASVDVAYSDAVTGAKQIQMLGLSGIYVQTIAENMPSVRGMASPYGLGYVPGPWMESIQISKGTSSVVNGYEAIAGQINVEYKKPEGDEKFHFNLYENDELKTEINLNGTIDITDRLSTMVLLHAENHTRELDKNGDGFMDSPMMKQIHFMNRWNLKGDGCDHRTLTFKVLDESRMAGQMGANAPESNLYGIDISTRRYEVIAKNGFQFNRPGTSLGIQLSASFHSQNAMYGKTEFSGTQYSQYLNVIYESNFGSDLHKYSTGVSFNGDQYQQGYTGINTEMVELVPGAFFQYTYNEHDRFTLLAGIRADYSSRYGAFFTPRLHAKWHLNEWLTWRASAGKGFRTALPLAENSYLMASSRNILIDMDLQQEEAVNAGTNLTANIPLGEKEITVMVDYYRTEFLNQVVRDVDSDRHAVHFYNLNGRSYSNALQAEVIFEPFERFTLNAAYRLNDVKQSIGGELREMPLLSRYKGLVSVSYATRMEKWQFDFTSQFNGGGRMPNPDNVAPLWNERFDPYSIFNAQITKNYKKWSFYIGAENLSNFSMSTPIVAANNPWGNDFDGSMIWGPLSGRKVYAGLRYTIFSYK